MYDIGFAGGGAFGHGPRADRLNNHSCGFAKFMTGLSV
jgi:hypothetical protein